MLPRLLTGAPRVLLLELGELKSRLASMTKGKSEAQLADVARMLANNPMTLLASTETHEVGLHTQHSSRGHGAGGMELAHAGQQPP